MKRASECDKRWMANHHAFFSPSDKLYDGSSRNHINYIVNKDDDVMSLFFRWHGNLKFTIGRREKTQAKSGYCAIVLYEKPFNNCDNSEACKTVGY